MGKNDHGIVLLLGALESNHTLKQEHFPTGYVCVSSFKSKVVDALKLVLRFGHTTWN